MSLLLRLADKFADRLQNVALDVVAGIPRAGTEGDMRRAHDEWLRGVQLGRTYFASGAQYIWVATEMNGAGDARLVLLDGYTFIRRDHNAAYTDSGFSSWQAWWRSDLDGLNHPEPPKPPKGRDFFLEADLADAAHPERWTVTYQ